MIEFMIFWFAAVLIVILHRYARLHIHHGHPGPVRIECLACRDRRRLVRYGTIGIVVAMVVGEVVTVGAVHWPDFGFLALVLVTELT